MILILLPFDRYCDGRSRSLGRLLKVQRRAGTDRGEIK